MIFVRFGKEQLRFLWNIDSSSLGQDDINNPKVTKLPKQAVGDEKYQDVNGDGLIDANDRIIDGQPTPKYTWGLTNTFRYKSWDLNVQLYGQHGGAILSYMARAIDNPGNGKATNLGVWRNRYSFYHQSPHSPRGNIGYAYSIPYTTTDWLYSTDFWRIQNITVGYNFRNIAKTGVISTMRVYASALNWFGWDKYKGGVNPESQNTNLTNGTYPLPGDYGAMPLSKSIILGVNVGF